MLMWGVRDTNVLPQWRTVSRTVRHKHPESGDARAEHAPRAPLGPTSPWEAPGVRVDAAGGLRGVLEGGLVSHSNFVVVNFWARSLRTVVAAG